jgi:hypothetical protein
MSPGHAVVNRGFRAFAGGGPPVAGKGGHPPDATRILVMEAGSTVMTQSTAAGVLGAIGLITAAAAFTVIWLVVHEPIKVADAIARWL